MKKITYLFLFFIGIMTNSFAQLSEDFESGTFPPAGWTIETTNLTNTWVSEAAGINGASALVNWIAEDQDESLISPVFTVPTNASLYFNLVMGYEYGVDPFDNYDFIASISTDGGMTWTQLWTENDWGLYVDYATLNVVVDLAAYSGESNVKLKFNYVGNDGDVLLLDDVVVETTSSAPDCASNLMPLDGSTGISSSGDIIFTWDAPTTGDLPTSYNIYGGTDINALTLFDNTTDLTYNAGSAGVFNTTLYWQIVPVNNGGEATGCPVFSFTTEAAPGFCLTGDLYPTDSFDPTTCDGLTENVIVTDAWTGEYSVVNVIEGVSYVFNSGTTDFITLSTDDGATAAAFGATPLSWTSTVTGEVRFYSHNDDQCGAEQVSRVRSVVCNSSIAAPDCASNYMPMDMATNVPVGAFTATWDAPTTGGTPTSYDFYAGDSPTTLQLVGNYTETTTGTDLNLTGFSTTIYWQVIPKNLGGSATGCPIFSFTTEDAPGYCLTGDLYPTDSFDPTTCDGLTENVIVTNAWTGEYSVVNVIEGENYIFNSGTTDFITLSTDDGATAASFGVTPLSWTSTVTGEVRFYSHDDDQCGTEQVNRVRSVVCGTPAADSPDYVSLQWPPTATISQGGSFTVYGQVYEAGLTDVAPNIDGQAPGITAWVGVSATNSNPNNFTNWTAMTINAGSVSNNDEYQATIGAGLAPGTYYYATRFNLNGGAYVFGGINPNAMPVSGNFWDGTTFISGVLTVTAPVAPANDDCSGATALTPGATFDANPVTGTILAATTTAGITPTCQALFSSDVWYSVVVPNSGSLTIETQTATSNSMTDSVVAAFTGTCGSLTQIGCDDDGGLAGVNNFMSVLPLTGLTPGQTIYIGVWKYAVAAPSGTNSGFRISAYDASLSNGSFDNTSFTYYPNPVKNVLNLSYNQNISQVEVYNLLGQQMTSKSFDATTATIDMASYTSGVYLVKVTSNNTTKTIRVIKE